MTRPFSLSAALGAICVPLSLFAACHGAIADDNKTEISLQPRDWHAFVSDSSFQNADNGMITSSKASSYDLAGLTVGIRNPAILGNATLALTALYGEGASEFSRIEAGAPFSASSWGTNSGTRFDAEALTIIPVRDGVTAFAGFRYINWNEKYSFSEMYIPEIDFTMSLSGLSQTQVEKDYFAELGGGISAPISDNGRHIFFANLTGLIGVRDLKTMPSIGQTTEGQAWAAGVDANVGYAFVLMEDMKLSARYRVFIYAPIENMFSNGNYIVHGPEVGLTYDLDQPGRRGYPLESDGAPSHATQSPHATPSGTQLSFQPREWYAFLSKSYYENPSTPIFDLTTAQRYPMSGGTIGVKNGDLLGSSTLALTALYGQAHAGYSSVSTSGPGFLSEVDKGYTDASRLDAEALFIIPSTERMNFILGGRYISWTYSYSINQAYMIDQITGDNVPLLPFGLLMKGREDDFFAEAGGGATSLLSDDGKHMLFANVVGIMGKFWTVEESVLSGASIRTSAWAGGIDANAGYAYQLTPDIKFSARYRITLYAPLHDWSLNGNALMHGPEVGLTFDLK